MSNIVLSSKNVLDSGVSWYGNADASYPLTNLANERFSKVWRYTPASNADGNTARFAFSMSPVARASHLALCRHNLGEAAQIRVRAGMARLDADFTSDSPTTHELTFGGGANGTRTNEYGVMVAGTCPRYEHDRRYPENGFKYSEDLNQADWLVSFARKYSDGMTVAFEVGAASTVNLVTNGAFDTDASGWTAEAGAGGTMTWNAGAVDLSTTAGGGSSGMKQTMALVSGQQYALGITLSGTVANSLVTIGTFSGDTSALYSGVLPAGTSVLSFTASGASQVILIRNLGSASATTMTVDNVSVREVASEIKQVVGSMYADSYEVRAQVRLVSGDGAFQFKVSDDAGTFSFGSTKTATADWQWFSDTLSCATNTGATAGHASIYKLAATGVLQIRKLQIRRGASNGKYRKTTSQRLYQRIGVITEAGATNSLLHSADLTNVAWTKTASGAITSNTRVAPDGTTTMDTATASAIGYAVRQDIAAGGTTAKAVSWIFRGAGVSTATECQLVIYWQAGGVTQYAVCRFNPSTGAYIGPASAGATLRAAGVKDLGGGFYRAYVMGVGTDAANTVVRTEMYFNSTGSLVAWGAQNEASFVTTYIPTTTAAVTRTVDTAVVEAATWVPYVWNVSEGTLYHEAMPDDIPTETGADVELNTVLAANGGAAIYSQLRYVSGVGPRHRVSTSAFTGASSATLAASTAARSALRYRASDWAHYVNGTQVSVSTAALVSAGASVDLMSTPSGTGYLRRVTLWPTGKSNTELQSLTTNGPSAIDYDSGWDDALQMSFAGDVPTLWGHDYDIIKTFSARSVEWVRIQVYDPAKTSSAFEIGRAFIGKLTLQPAQNAEYGLGNAWQERTTFTQTESGRKIFHELPRIREVAFSFPRLTHAEGATLHELQGSGGTSAEVLYLPDPDDEAECQRYGFVGLLSQLDPLRYPLVNTRSASFQIAKKR